MQADLELHSSQLTQSLFSVDGLISGIVLIYAVQVTPFMSRKYTMCGSLTSDQPALRIHLILLTRGLNCVCFR